MAKGRRKATAVPGGGSKGTSLKDVYKLKTAEGYKTTAEIQAGSAKSYEAQDSLNALMGTEFASGTSIFDPVLCELAYRWFSPHGGSVIDPFAGGSVRGIVASKLGRRYTGVDLSGRQVEANRVQGEIICASDIYPPQWIEGNSLDIEQLAPGSYDFIFSCPPYADLEVYSDDPRDLSTMDYPQFRAVYAEIIAAATRLLAPNRFACFVVGDARDKAGMYYGFPWHTIEAFQAAGLELYNEAVLVTAVGSLPVRITRQFQAGRKMGRSHQNVLVFVKGDPKKAAELCKDDT